MKNKKTEQKIKKGKRNTVGNGENENEENEIEEEYNPKLDPKQIISFDYYLDTVYDIISI